MEAEGRKRRTMFDSKNRFIIENYNKQSCFASFLPGISGIHGTPLWNFYVNRGQAVCSFGSENKDHSIMEFYPAHQSYQLTKTMGFRTFLKVDGTFYEPFTEDAMPHKMYIGMNELEIEETNEALGIRINVLYYTMPNERLGGLVRTVTIHNLTAEEKEIELLDGMPALLPYGIELKDMKETAQTTKAWMQVEDVAQGLPYYRVRIALADAAEVSEVEAGNFMISVNEKGEVLPVIADPELVFDYDTSYKNPVNFMQTEVLTLAASRQLTANQVPSGFACAHEKLKDSYTLYSVYGQAGTKELFHTFAKSGLNRSFFTKKQEENDAIIQELANNIATETADPVFDAYCKQTYIDNVLRGGYPVALPGGHVFYVYSRKHGDVERDYNFFSMLPEYYSQGNGNFRDVNQNRRSDIYFANFVGDYNIKVFYNLIQLDGYNPLQVKQITYSLRADAKELVLSKVTDNREVLDALFEKTFTPGNLYAQIYNRKVGLCMEEDAFFALVMEHSVENLNADFGEGYWSDHWTYNLDLVDAYLSVYPEHEETLLFEDKTYTYYESKATVLPRKKRYVRTEKGVRQYHSIDEEQKAAVTHDKARTGYGTGEVYRSNLATKLVLMSVLKFDTLDMKGIGIEMEGGKPGWYDALNGLPGLFGSSVCETYELQRMLLYLRKVLTKYPRSIELPKEAAGLLMQTAQALQAYKEHGDRLTVWNETNLAKEAYREKTAFGIDGAEVFVEVETLLAILDAMISYVEEGISLGCSQKDGIAPAYMAYSMSDYTEEAGRIVPMDLQIVDIPLFLEGPVRYLKLPQTKATKEALYEKVKASAMYDRKLDMYKVNAPLEACSYEIGRARAFSPGWLENESIWLHMEYKYLLELLKSGLYEEYFADLKKMGVPFLPYETYGRSPLENSSFLVSSANFNEKIHGKGFVARLSGSTAEFLQMWELMMNGDRLFTVEDEKLCFRLTPAIPAYLIGENKTVTTTLFGKTRVVYQFAEQKDIIPGQYQIEAYELVMQEGTVRIEADCVTGEAAQQIRKGVVEEIRVQLR